MNQLALQGNYAVSGGVKGVEAVEAKAKSFKARMTVSSCFHKEPVDVPTHCLSHLTRKQASIFNFCCLTFKLTY